MNRSHNSYTPGGVFSGVNIVEPDFPELMEDHPFIWQQSEYIIHGATPFVFTTLALKNLLKVNQTK
jgi:endoglucanase